MVESGQIRFVGRNVFMGERDVRTMECEVMLPSAQAKQLAQALLDVANGAADAELSFTDP